MTCVQLPVFEQTFSTVASREPPVLRICIWIWSYVIVSSQFGWYQNVSFGLPDGTFTVCARTLSPLYGLGEPSIAAYEPLWADVTICGVESPEAVQFTKDPASKLPFCGKPVAGAETVTLTVVV